MARPEPSLNPEMLYIARTALGMSQTEFAERVGISQPRLSRLEDGLMSESNPDFLQILADKTGFPESFFTQGGARAPLREAFFRRKKTTGVGQLRQAEAVININRLAIQNLISKYELDRELPLPSWDPEEFQGGPAEVARQLRYAWQIPPGPIKNLTEIMEMAGIVIAYADFPVPSIDGVTIWMSGGIPLVLLNPLFSAVKIRMTLAHELGHIIMHKIPTPNMEEEAFRFAGEFLMPIREIGPSLYPLDLDTLQTLKLRFKVSMQGILKHALENGKIKEGYYKFLQIKISERGWRKQEPGDDFLPREMPCTVTELLELHRHDMNYTDEEILDVLKIPDSRASWLLGSKRPNFRII